MPDGDDGRGADDWDGDIPGDYPSGAPDGEWHSLSAMPVMPAMLLCLS